MARSTQAAVALNALVDVLQAAPLPGLVVEDGPAPKTIVDDDVLYLGWGVNAPDVEIAQEVSDEGGGRDERLTIACVVSCHRGEHDRAFLKVVRTRAVEVVDWVADMLDVDPTLGGIVSSAELGLVSAVDQDTEGRCVAAIEFAIVVQVL